MDSTVPFLKGILQESYSLCFQKNNKRGTL